MALSEQIGGTQLSTYGLRLSRLGGNMDLPAFKNILEEHDFENNLLVLDESTIKIKLIGFYATKPDLGNAIASFYTKVKSAVKLEWLFTNHAFYADCVVKDVRTSIYGTAVEIEIMLSIVSNLSLNLLPVVETLEVSGLIYGSPSNICDFNLNLVSHGDGGFTTHTIGFHWGSSPESLTHHAGYYFAEGVSIGNFTAEDLEDYMAPDADVYVRAYAENAAGRAYGEILMFHTLSA